MKDPLDRYYTKPEVAHKCWAFFQEKVRPTPYSYYVDPCVGEGAFYKMFPRWNSHGYEIDPSPNGTSCYLQDFLEETPERLSHFTEQDAYPLIFMSNPPFGMRGAKALAFVNKSFELGADYVAFILPPMFRSDGKGSPAKRVVGGGPIADCDLPADSFYDVNGKGVKINCIFQIWKRGAPGIQRLDYRLSFKVLSISNGGTPATTRNKRMIGKCDFYLPMTCYKGMKAYEKFEELPYQRGYGIVIPNKWCFDKIMEIDWKGVSFKSTNGALNLRRSIIEKAILEVWVDR